MLTGQVANISVANETRKQYQTLRHYPADNNKYCYTLDVISRTRYLIRATFLYGDFDNNNVYPKFDISFGPTHWATIVISDADTIESQELIFLATDRTVSICLSNATTGVPFISTLELRQFNANYLVDVAPGTEKISTRMPIDVSRDERPPQKVMQTAVVGRNGSLTYRLNLDGFPAFGWAFTYFAEIEDLGPNDTRKFRLILPGDPDLSKAAVDIQENAQGKYRLYEPGYYNISLPFVLSFRFARTSDSTRGPLLNAMEINKYLKKSDGSSDGPLLADVAAAYSSAELALEGGDPKLSGKNLTGAIPVELTKLSGLVELWLDNNSLSGPIPDFSGCPNLRRIHLENNQLTGDLSSSLGDLSNLRELYVQNNRLSGKVPSGLLNKDMSLNYTGNPGLRNEGNKGNHKKIIIGTSVGASVLLIATIAAFFLLPKGKKKYPPTKGKFQHGVSTQKLMSSLGDNATEAAHYFPLSEIEDATNKFERKIGSGGFGVVYYGRLKDGREIAVKILTNDSFQGKREFSNEVSLLSRIHHRNLVQFLGYCQEDGKSILVYEFMHNGTLKEHLYGPLTHGRGINWIKRLEIAEDAAKGCFGVILLELISGQEAISNENFGINCRNIVQWAKLHIESGDIQGIIDPTLREYDIQSMWKIAEKALMCVQPHGSMRPSISEVIKEIQDAITIEKGTDAVRDGSSDEISRHSVHSSLNLGGSLDMGASDHYLSIDDSIARPTAR
ncbi:probable LRR receptor-like serine/threonine-protein kinase at1g67720 [Phtheirospermum japonicum]|uniref:non-specific serine/threonine protein kinase n=1 Tax=Phtheirospermum japonicum TaxID=374723 RepID=A0A830BHW7_9LAMI|nr:probable LRR receptor-like serine/threonine-protein kinase at1g67720 [Phtheirospermum japonicum]